MVHPTQPEAKKVIVYSLNGQVMIEATDREEMRNGDWVSVIDINPN
jgi:hypothetical protein